MTKVRDRKPSSEFPRTDKGKTMGNALGGGGKPMSESEKVTPYGGKPHGNNAKDLGGKKSK